MIFTNWTRATDSVLGFAKVKYKGFTNYGEAAAAMECARQTDFCVFDGQSQISRAEYEQTERMHNIVHITDLIKDNEFCCTIQAATELTPQNPGSVNKQS